MNEVLLVLVMFCGTPVSATLATPEGMKMWPVGPGMRRTVLSLAEEVKAGGGRVEMIRVEKMVEETKCPVST